MDDEHIEVILDDEPAPPKNDTLVITNADLADVDEQTVYPGFRSPADASMPGPGYPGAWKPPAPGKSMTPVSRHWDRCSGKPPSPAPSGDFSPGPSWSHLRVIMSWSSHW